MTPPKRRPLSNRARGLFSEPKARIRNHEEDLSVPDCRLFLAGLILPGGTSADEGMWLFNNPPTNLLRQNYSFSPTKDWLEHVQRSSVRFNSGGSGSFVSADGLVMTNHHVGTDCIQKLGNQLEEGLHEDRLPGEVAGGRTQVCR